MVIFTSTLGTASVSIPDMHVLPRLRLLRLLLLVLVLGIMRGIRHGQGERELECIWVWVYIWGRRRVLHILDSDIANDEEPTYTRKSVPSVVFSSRSGAHVQPTNTPALQRMCTHRIIHAIVSPLLDPRLFLLLHPRRG